MLVLSSEIIDNSYQQALGKTTQKSLKNSLFSTYFSLIFAGFVCLIELSK
jgi:hypothetical protein